MRIFYLSFIWGIALFVLGALGYPDIKRRITMSLSAKQAVYSVGRYRILEAIEGADSRMHLRGLSEDELTRPIAVCRRHQPTKTISFTVHVGEKTFQFDQTKAGSKKLFCREIS